MTGIILITYATRTGSTKGVAVFIVCMTLGLEFGKKVTTVIGMRLKVGPRK